jgi:hypothetical protein
MTIPTSNAPKPMVPFVGLLIVRQSAGDGGGGFAPGVRRACCRNCETDSVSSMSRLFSPHRCLMTQSPGSRDVSEIFLPGWRWATNISRWVFIPR